MAQPAKQIAFSASTFIQSVDVDKGAYKVYNFADNNRPHVIYNEIQVFLTDTNKVIFQTRVTSVGSHTLNPANNMHTGPHVTIQMFDSGNLRIFHTKNIGELTWKCSAENHMIQYEAQGDSELYNKAVEVEMIFTEHTYRKCF